MEKKKVQTVIFRKATDNKKQFLLLQMNERRNFLWQNVTGGVDDGESFEKAAVREAIEETALLESNIQKLTELPLEFKFFDQWKKNVIEKVYALECKEKWIINIDPSEHSNFKWVDENQITRNSVHYESNFQALQKVMELE